MISNLSNQAEGIRPQHKTFTVYRKLVILSELAILNSLSNMKWHLPAICSIRKQIQLRRYVPYFRNGLLHLKKKKCSIAILMQIAPHSPFFKGSKKFRTIFIKTSSNPCIRLTFCASAE